MIRNIPKIVPALLFLLISNTLAYHDPDLNYHLSQVNKLEDCGPSGYSYPVPPVQLTAAGVSAALPAAHAYPNNIQYASPPAFSQSYVNHPGPGYARQELHGYATSVGLSQFSGPKRPTVIPQATYAQAPIIAKITAAPLIAKYAITPPKPFYLAQNAIQQQAIGYASGSIAKASLYDNYHPAGPVVSQVIAAPTVRYAAAPPPQQLAPAPLPPPALPVYGPPQQQRYPPRTVAQYFSANKQYSAPPPPVPLAPINYAAAAAAPVLPAAPAPFLPPPAPLPIRPVLPHGLAKNVHTEFLENYDANPQYSYEYSVHDPNTGDIKQQKETRDGEVVRGQYSLVEPDGSVRTVDYVADWDTGFHATVRNSKDNQH